LKGREKMQNGNIIETKTAKIFLDDDGIIHIITTAENHSIEDAKEVTAAVEKVTQFSKHPALIDSTRTKELSPECREYYSSGEVVLNLSAIAILIKSGIPRILANFFMDISKLPGPPRKLFSNEEKAVEWLKSTPANTFDVQKYSSRKNISIAEIKETSIANVFLGDDGIIRVLPIREMHSVAEAKELTAAVDEITKGIKHPILVDSTRISDMSPESREYYSSGEAVLNVSALAIVIKSGISRIMANFFMNISKIPGPPRKLFNDDTQAVKWLKAYLEAAPSVTGDNSGMNVLIYEPISQIQKPIIYTFIKNGIKCLCLNDRKDIMTRLNSKKYYAFIFSCSPGAKEIIDIIRQIRQNEDLNFIKLILWTAPAAKSFFEDMIKLGIIGIIIKPFVEESFEKNIFKLLFRDGVNPDRRQTIRVEPDADDRIIVAIRTSTTHKTIVCKLRSLSMDGMVVEMTGEFTEDDLKDNDAITNNNIKITIDENDISTNGFVFTRKQNIVVIKFSEMQEYYKNMLSSYIYRRLNIS
jgi:DNA-binding response OmpR family regulator